MQEGTTQRVIDDATGKQITRHLIGSAKKGKLLLRQVSPTNPRIALYWYDDNNQPLRMDSLTNGLWRAIATFNNGSPITGLGKGFYRLAVLPPPPPLGQYTIAPASYSHPGRMGLYRITADVTIRRPTGPVWS